MLVELGVVEQRYAAVLEVIRDGSTVRCLLWWRLGLLSCGVPILVGGLLGAGYGSRERFSTQPGRTAWDDQQSVSGLITCGIPSRHHIKQPLGLHIDDRRGPWLAFASLGDQLAGLLGHLATNGPPTPPSLSAAHE